MTYLAGIHDLAYVFTRAGAAADAGSRQDWVSMGANIAGGIGKFIWYKKSHGVLKETLEKVGKKALPTPTAIIDVTMVAVAVIDLLNGFGPPNNGSGIENGISQLKLVNEKLEAAIPDSRDWDGDAATAYAAQNAALRDLVTRMQELDRQLKEIVAKQGDETTQAHRTLAILGFALVAAQGVALMLYLYPIIGPELSLLFQVVAALAATTTVVVQETLLISRSMNHADAAELVAGQYVSLGQSSELGGSFATIKVLGAEETTVGSFTAISDGLSAFSAAPSVASLMRSAGDTLSEPQRTTLRLLAEPENPVDGSPGTAPETPGGGTAPDEGTTPTEPRFTLPTMAQLTSMSGQVAKLSANVAQPMNVGNQIVGSVQQVVSMAQQGQTAGAPAAAADATVAEVTQSDAASDEPAGDEAVLAGTVDEVADVGDVLDEVDLQLASSGASGERAPVDAAAVEGEREEPGRAQRFL